MKLKAAILAIAFAAASATSAGSTAVDTNARQLQRSAVVQDLDDCMLPYYTWCIKTVGDYGYCMDTAQSYACPN